MTRIGKGFFMLMSPPNLMASLIPMAVGFAAALQTLGRAAISDVIWFLFAVFAMVLIETGKNTVNEYFDYLSGTDRFIDEAHLTPFSGGRRVLPSGALTEKEVIVIGVICFGIAIGAGLIMVFFRTFLIFWIGVLGVVISICYTLPPFKLCYRALGEVAVGLVYGPLIVLGSYTLLTRQYALTPLLLSLPICFLVMNILVINEFPDYEADLRAKKRNLVVVLGKQRAIYLYSALFCLAYLSVVPLLLYTRNPLFLLLLLTLPIAVKAVLNCKKHYDTIPLLTASNKMTIAIHALTGVFMILAIVWGYRFS